MPWEKRKLIKAIEKMSPPSEYTVAMRNHYEIYTSRYMCFAGIAISMGITFLGMYIVWLFFPCELTIPFERGWALAPFGLFFFAISLPLLFLARRENYKRRKICLKI